MRIQVILFLLGLWNYMRGNVEQNCSCFMFACCGNWKICFENRSTCVALARSRAHKGCAVGTEARGSNPMLWQFFDSTFWRFDARRFGLVWILNFASLRTGRPKVGSEDEGTELSTRGNENTWESKYFSLVCKLQIKNHVDMLADLGSGAGRPKRLQRKKTRRIA